MCWLMTATQLSRFLQIRINSIPDFVYPILNYLNEVILYYWSHTLLLRWPFHKIFSVLAKSTENINSLSAGFSLSLFLQHSLVLSHIAFFSRHFNGWMSTANESAWLIFIFSRVLRCSSRQTDNNGVFFDYIFDGFTALLCSCMCVHRSALDNVSIIMYFIIRRTNSRKLSGNDNKATQRANDSSAI